MKKLIIALTAVALAAGVQGASFSWKCTTATQGALYDYTGATKLVSGTKAYLIDAGVTSQAALLAAARGESFAIASYAVSSADLNSSSKIAATDFSYGTTGNDYTFYFAILDTANDQLLISTTKTGAAQAADTTALNFASDAATFSKASYGTAAYGSAGWYSTVPEPTSGLLLLLGMAGLALKRKRA